VMTTGVPSFT